MALSPVRREGARRAGTAGKGGVLKLHLSCSPTRAGGGRGAAGAACQVPQQLRGRGAEAGAHGRGTGVLRGGPRHQPGQRPSAAPPGAGGPATRPTDGPAQPRSVARHLPLLSAATGAAGPGRGSGGRSEASPGAGPSQQGPTRHSGPSEAEHKYWGERESHRSCACCSCSAVHR